MVINTHERREIQKRIIVTPDQAQTWQRVMVSEAGKVYTGRIIMRICNSFMQLREDVPANTSPEKAKYTDPSAFDKNFDLREVGVRVYPHPQDYIPGLAEYDEAPRILQAARERRAPEIVAHTAAHTAVEQTILLY